MRYDTMRLKLLLVLFLGGSVCQVGAHGKPPGRGDSLAFDPGSVTALDSHGIPRICGTVPLSESETPAPAGGGGGDLPAGTRGWECRPGVIRADGADSFLLFVDVNGPVARVTLEMLTFSLTPGSPATLELRDDGEPPDQQAGDSVFTVGPFRYNTSSQLPEFFGNDPESPRGLLISHVGSLHIEELDGTTSQFLLQPQIGLVHPDVPPVEIESRSEHVQVSRHLVNVRTADRITQRALRSLGADLSELTVPLYAVVPDQIDFLMLFSTLKIERLPRLQRQNFYAGQHRSVRIDFTGTGKALFDNSAFYGSRGRLQGINLLDAYDRGVYVQNATHEIVHQWAAFLDPSLGITDGTAHYNPRSSVGSLVGGQRWDRDGKGNFVVNCEEGRNRAHHAPPLDLYLMGLLDAAEVEPLHAYSDESPGPLLRCGEVIDDIVRTVTIEEIQARHGQRVPGPENSQRHFAVAFVAESHERFLDATEMTFYDVLAEHYTRSVPPEAPPPYLTITNWVPITRFFPGTEWTSEIPRPEFVRGDGNRDGGVDVSDSIFVLLALFGPSPGPPACPDALDSNDDGSVDLSDSVYLLQHLFLGGPTPPPPFPAAGRDPTEDSLGCQP